MSELTEVLTVGILGIIAAINFFGTWHLKILNENGRAYLQSDIAEIKAAVESAPAEYISEKIQDTPPLPLEKEIEERIKEIFAESHGDAE